MKKINLIFIIPLIISLVLPFLNVGNVEAAVQITNEESEFIDENPNAYIQNGEPYPYYLPDKEGTLFNPSEANANPFIMFSTLATVFVSARKAGEGIQSLRTFMVEAVAGLVTNFPGKLACGGEYTDEDHAKAGPPDLSGGGGCTGGLVATLDAEPTTYNPMEKPYGVAPTRASGGLASFGVSSIAMIIEETPMPVDLALFINDITEDSMFGTPSYAATTSSSSTFMTITFNIWKYARNIAIMALAVMLAIAGLMVMFRKKISPQATATIYNVLPSVPLAILFIVMSYPIISLAISLIGPLAIASWTFASRIALDILSTSTLIAPSTTLTPTSFFALAINIVFFMTGAWMISFPMFIVGVLMLLIFIITLLAFIFSFAKIYFNFFMYAISAPFIGAISILPGKQGLMINHLKKILLEVLVLPIMLLITMIGAIIVIAPITIDPFDPTLGNVWGSLLLVIMKSFIGIGIMWSAHKSRKLLMGAFNVDTSLFGTGGNDKRR